MGDGGGAGTPALQPVGFDRRTAGGFMMFGMSKKLRWGVLSTANIGLKKVLPAMQRCQYATIDAICSRDLWKPRRRRRRWGFRAPMVRMRSWLPIRRSTRFTTRCRTSSTWSGPSRPPEAGKHVLCEKPLSMTLAEAETLLAVRARTGVKIGEAFMIRSHPQWLRLEELIASGRIGTLKTVSGVFSYYNTDPKNIRNQVETGGGAMYDIGCYLIQAARTGFKQEPTRVVGLLERDPVMETDRLASAILDFPGGHAVFTCGAQIDALPAGQFSRHKGPIEIEIPFNALPDRPMRLFTDKAT